MLNFQGALLFTWTLRQIFRVFFTHVVTRTLALVAIFTEVSRAPTEPLRH